MSSISSPVRIAHDVTTPHAAESARAAENSWAPRASQKISGPLADLALSSRSRSVSGSGSPLRSEEPARRSSLPTQSPDASPTARGRSSTRDVKAAAEGNSSADAADHESPASQPQADGPSTMQRLQSLLRHSGPRIAPHIPPALDGVAAAADLAEGFFTSLGAAKGLKISSTTSGVTWAASAIASELNNQLGDSPHSSLVSAANLFGAIAGGLSAALPYAATNESTGIGYGSASAWISAGAATVAAGAGAVRLGDTFAKVLQGGSGVANGVAAALAEFATVAAAENNASQAAALTIASGAMWLVGSVAAEGAVLRESQVSARANHSVSTGASPV
jgi:hypothetical protein